MAEYNIGGVAETMIQTLYARAKESKKKNPKIYDAKAIEIVSKMDYDFSKADKDFAMSSGVIARTILLDRMVKKYIEKHPNTTVINIACGNAQLYLSSDIQQIRYARNDGNILQGR